MRKINCVVLDDEPFALDLMIDYIRRTPFLHIMQSFSNPFKALEFINREKPDLIFLDINMPELSGLQLIQSLAQPPLVIFTTAYSEYAAESYEYNAVDYLVKPIRYERFLKAVNKASLLFPENKPQIVSESSLAIDSKDNHIFVKSGHQQMKLSVNDILYVEAAGNYMSFCTKEKKIMSLLSMKDALELLPAHAFVRVHKSYLVAKKHIEAVGRHDIRVGEKEIPIGITWREHFFKVMNIQ